MKPSIIEKLENLSERFEEISMLLSDPDVISDQNRFRDLSKEYAELKPVVDCFESYKNACSNKEEALEKLQNKSVLSKLLRYLQNCINE